MTGPPICQGSNGKVSSIPVKRKTVIDDNGFYRGSGQIELIQDKDFYNLGMEGGPTFQVANQVKN